MIMNAGSVVSVVLGRDSGCDMVFPASADTVSRRHAEASWSEDLECIVVRDLGSANGTLPGEDSFSAADGSIRLGPDQFILLGEETVTFAEIKRALDEKTRRFEADETLQQRRSRRNRISKVAALSIGSLLLLGALAGSVWHFLETAQRTEDAQEAARAAAALAELAREEAEVAREAADSARRAREEADELIADRELEVDPDAKMIGPFLDHENGTVTDTRTGLMWRRCSLGLVWDAGRCTGDRGTYPWDRAAAAIDLVNSEGGLSGYTDWRLPTLVELMTLVQEGSGLRQREAFPGVSPSHHWSATPWNAELRRYWNVHLGDGIGYWDEAAILRAVLPIRDVTTIEP
jgi:hypothetical protein